MSDNPVAELPRALRKMVNNAVATHVPCCRTSEARQYVAALIGEEPTYIAVVESINIMIDRFKIRVSP